MNLFNLFLCYGKTENFGCFFNRKFTIPTLFFMLSFFPFWCNNFGWPKTKKSVTKLFLLHTKRMTKINRQIKCIILKCPFYIDFKTNRQYVAIWFCNLYTLLVWLTRIILFLMLQ